MPTDVPFFDTCYLVRLYLEDAGFEAVREVAGSGSAVAGAWHAQAELVTVLHRALRERRMAQAAYQAALDQFQNDCRAGLFLWQPLTEGVQQRLEHVLRKAPATAFVRAADALHLACAAEHSFRAIYSNDRHLLAAAPLFGLRGINVI